uniref:Uncharacterized protein n=1 Tax=Podoviridae sp. ct8Lf7 TaxID=2827723 RepID=A0A8S5S152_9CAUD|nr:MAG TPA: hypothetical protein [Podoviridae sp. ct8Lf7]
MPSVISPLYYPVSIAYFTFLRKVISSSFFSNSNVSSSICYLYSAFIY